MNYFEIINAILLELNYEQVAVFSDLKNSEHKRIMGLIQILNDEICQMSDVFYFRQLYKEMKVSADNISYLLRFSGKITKITGQNEVYKYEKDYSKFYTGNAQKNTYSIYGDKILFPQVDDELKIFYVSDFFVLDSLDNHKSNFEFETDKSLIPENFARKLLINGVAYRFKQNTSHPKYSHWKNEYEKALVSLLANSKRKFGDDLLIDGGFRSL